MCYRCLHHALLKGIYPVMHYRRTHDCFYKRRKPLEGACSFTGVLTSIVLPRSCQVFINSKYRSVYGGRATTDEEITGFLIATLFAGQHTSSITSSWTGFFMLTNQVCSPEGHGVVMQPSLRAFRPRPDTQRVNTSDFTRLDDALTSPTGTRAVLFVA